MWLDSLTVGCGHNFVPHADRIRRFTVFGTRQCKATQIYTLNDGYMPEKILFYRNESNFEDSSQLFLQSRSRSDRFYGVCLYQVLIIEANSLTLTTQIYHLQSTHSGFSTLSTLPREVVFLQGHEVTPHQFCIDYHDFDIIM